jgi:MinD-like ATPase involved in chromosome partitioning or flagellar assembly
VADFHGDQAAGLRRLLGRPQARIVTFVAGSLGDQPDVVLVDASPDHPLGFSPLGLAAHETVVVVSPDVAPPSPRPTR